MSDRLAGIVAYFEMRGSLPRPDVRWLIAEIERLRTTLDAAYQAVSREKDHAIAAIQRAEQAEALANVAIAWERRALRAEQQLAAAQAVVEAAKLLDHCVRMYGPPECQLPADRVRASVAAYEATLPPVQPAVCQECGRDSCEGTHAVSQWESARRMSFCSAHQVPVLDCDTCRMTWADQERENHLHGTMAGGPESDWSRVIGGRE